MIELVAIVALGSGCAICARLGYMRGRVVGERINAEINQRVLDEANAVLALSRQAEQAVDRYHELFDRVKPILEEHTWHKSRAEK